MPPDDIVIDTKTVRPGTLAYRPEAEPAVPETSYRFVRAILIGVPLALVLWAGIGLAIFRAFFER